MENTDILRPCPFCGSTDLNAQSRLTMTLDIDKVSKKKEGSEWRASCYVACNKCGALIRGTGGCEINEAQKKWNHRSGIRKEGTYNDKSKMREL